MATVESTPATEVAAAEPAATKFVPYAKQERKYWDGSLSQVRWAMGTYITIAHILALYGLTYIPEAKAATLCFSFLLWQLTAFGITGGAHRLWAHRSYSAAAPYRLVLMLLNSCANQGCIFHWARDHRVHHFHSETPADPHDAKRGFWFSHIGWLYIKKDPRVAEAGRKVDLSDLYADGFVMFQRKLDPWWNFFWCFFAPALFAHYAWGERMTVGVFLPGVLRYVWLLHCTWSVNSFAHLWGDRPYDPSSNPAENPIVSFLAIGEGWHNWHHKYPFDYAASEFGITSQYNPSKMLIDMAAAVGLVTDRKRATAMWNREKLKRQHAE